MKNIAVFPLNINTYYISKLFSFSKEFNFSGFLSDNPPTKEVTEIAEQMGIYEINTINSKDFLKQNIDIVFIADDCEISKEIIINLYNDLQILNKTIILSPQIEKKYNFDKKSKINVNSNKRLKYLDTIPVISVMGVGENTLKLETQALISELLDSYNILNITAKGCNVDNNFFSFPKDIFDPNISLPKKISILRNYLESIVEAENYQLIILSVPGSIFSDNTHSNNVYSEFPLIISNALSIDINIINIYSNFNASIDMIEELDKLCKYKFNSDLNLFNFVPICIRYNEDMIGNEHDYYCIDKITQENMLNQCSFYNYKELERIVSLTGNTFPSINKEFLLSKLTESIELV